MWETAVILSHRCLDAARGVGVRHDVRIHFVLIFNDEEVHPRSHITLHRVEQELVLIVGVVAAAHLHAQALEVEVVDTFTPELDALLRHELREEQWYAHRVAGGV